LRWILLIVAVFGVCGGVAVAYWRQTGVDVSPMTILMVLILLPSMLVASFFGFYQFKKWQKKRREAIEAAALDEANQPVVLAEGPAAPWLHVYAIAVQTQLGDHADKILLNLQQLHAADSDSELLHFDGTQLLSRRIDLAVNSEIDDENQPLVTSQLSARAVRIQAITQNLFNHLDQTLAAIAQGMSETQVWQQPTESRQVILHPAWQGKSVEASSPDASDVESSVSFPMVLKALFLLPEHLDEDEQKYLQQSAYSQLLAYGFELEQVQWTDQIVADSDQTLQAIGQTLMGQSTSTQSSMLLVIAADSGIDQDFMDQIQFDHQRLIPAEAGFAVLMTNENTAIADLPILARLTAPILSPRQKPINAGGRIAADALSTSLDELRRIYKVTDTAFVPDSGVLISDAHTMRSPTLRELTLALTPFELPSEQVVYAGSLLEDTDALMSGLALTVALQQAESSKQHVPVICSSGNTLRGAWIAAPFIPAPESDDVPAESLANI
jgi:phage shock protein PspC (stress-responsive transcriptional regulator)